MATRKDDGPVEVKDEATPAPGTKAPEDQTAADAKAAFEESVAADEPAVERKRRTTQTTDHREAAAAKVAGPSREKRAPAEIKWAKIKLHNNKEIPPGGLHVGVNGRSVKIPPDKWVEIEESFLEALDHAVRSEPVRNDNNQVVDYRDVPRFPYTLDRNYKG